MILAFIVTILCGLTRLLLLPLIALTAGWDALYAPLSAGLAPVTPWLAIIGNFVDLSTAGTCVIIILGLELLIGGWKLFTLVAFRK